MELVRLAEVDSTLTVAAAEIAMGRKAPFAVFAERQTAGRGRRGHGWESPKGNLYLTIVMPPSGSETPPEHLGSLPLKAGVLIARHLQARTGLRVTLKWPNDLLFAGRKLGGLLLETSSTDGVSGVVSIGIGLNLNLAPEIAGPYRSVALKELTGESYDVADWAGSLTDAFAAEWSRMRSVDVPPAFEND